LDTPFLESLYQWKETFMHRSMQYFSKYLKERSLSFPQTNTLMQLYHRESCSVSDVGDHLGVTKAAASQMLDKLVEQNLIQRTEDPKDRRNKIITLTDTGKALVSEGINARDYWITELDNLLTIEEKEQIIHSLNLLTEKASQLGE